MNIVTISAIILIAAIVSVTLRKHVPEYSMIVNISAGLVVALVLISSFLPVLNQIKSLFSYTKIPNEYGAILFKSLGICFVAQFVSDSCKDANENALASKVEFAGKIGIITAALPLFEKITQTALEFMGAR